MSADTEDRSPDRAVEESASAEMEDHLKQLDEHIDDAVKKAQAGRPQGSPKDGDVLDDVAGGGTDNTGEADDPEESPIVDTE